MAFAEISVRPTSTKPLTCYRAQIHDRVVRSYFIRDLSNGETLPLSAQVRVRSHLPSVKVSVLWLIYTAGFGLQNPMATLYYAEIFTLHGVRFRFQS